MANMTSAEALIQVAIYDYVKTVYATWGDTPISISIKSNFTIWSTEKGLNHMPVTVRREIMMDKTKYTISASVPKN